ncbi:MAG: chemotaxis protein CheW, partial [Burkholderiaceae bacterium]
MEQVAQLVVFVLAQQRFGVWLRHVECVLAAAETTPVPGAPPLVLGIIDLHGTMVPILDLRPRWLSSVP